MFSENITRQVDFKSLHIDFHSTLKDKSQTVCKLLGSITSQLVLLRC